MRLSEHHKMAVANGGSLGADLVVETEEIFHFTQESLDLPAQVKVPDHPVGGEAQAVDDEHVASARVSRVPGAEGDEDLLLAPEGPDHYQEGIGEEGLHGCDIEFQGHAELSVRMGERGKDGDVGFYGGRFGGDVSRGHHVGLRGVWFLAGRVVNDREAIADGAAMMVRLDEAQAVAVERFGVPLDRGEEKARRSVRC